MLTKVWQVFFICMLNCDLHCYTAKLCVDSHAECHDNGKVLLKQHFIWLEIQPEAKHQQSFRNRNTMESKKFF